jgi:hypothetical protein
MHPVYVILVYLPWRVLLAWCGCARLLSMLAHQLHGGDAVALHACVLLCCMSAVETAAPWRALWSPHAASCCSAVIPSHSEHISGSHVCWRVWFVAVACRQVHHQSHIVYLQRLGDSHLLFNCMRIIIIIKLPT